MVTGLAEGEAVCGLISRLAAVVCRAIGPSLSGANLMSCTDWADKALWGEISSYWVNKQPASCRNMPEIGFQQNHQSGQGLCFYQASGIEKYCLVHVCFGLDIFTVFTWEALALHIKNNDVKGGQL